MERSVATFTDQAEPALDDLAGKLREAMEASEKGPRLGATAAVVSAAVPVSDIDPLAAFAAAAPDDAIYWEQPSQRFAFAALGTALRIDVGDENRFKDAAQQWRAIGSRVVGRSAPGIPAPPLLGVGIFAFDDQRPPDAVWSGLSRNVWHVPSSLVARRGEHTWLQVQTCEAGPTRSAGASPAIASLAKVIATARASASAAGQQRGRAPSPAQRPLRRRDDPPHAWWRETVARALTAIERGDLEKIVLAGRVEAQAELPFEVPAVLGRLRSRFPQATTFAVRHAGRSFVGAAPERLVALQRGVVSASAVAGTARNGTADRARGAATTLLTDSKERREHAYVVRALQAALGPLCRRLDVPDEPTLLRLPGLQHLHTPISGTLATPATALELVGRLHPTPAVGGVPQDCARALLRDYEPFDRGWYAGPLGWMDGTGDGEFVVTLRSALLDANRAMLYGGCGIVAGSDGEREWEESRLKMESMLWALTTP